MLAASALPGNSACSPLLGASRTLLAWDLSGSCQVARHVTSRVRAGGQFTRLLRRFIGAGVERARGLQGVPGP